MVFLDFFIIVLLATHTLLIENYRKWFLKIEMFTFRRAILLSVLFFTIIIRNEETR